MKTLDLKNRKKIKGVYMQIYLHLSCLQSYTNSLGTNLMLIHSTFLNGLI